MTTLTTDTIESLIARIRAETESIKEIDPDYPEPSRDKKTWDFAINCFIGILDSQLRVSKSTAWAQGSPIGIDNRDNATTEAERLAKYILSLDNGYPVVSEESPNGMGAVDAAIMTIEAYRHRVRELEARIYGLEEQYE